MLHKQEAYMHHSQSIVHMSWSLAIRFKFPRVRWLAATKECPQSAVCQLQLATFTQVPSAPPSQTAFALPVSFLPSISNIPCVHGIYRARRLFERASAICACSVHASICQNSVFAASQDRQASRGGERQSFFFCFNSLICFCLFFLFESWLKTWEILVRPCWRF